uniref:Uncharacterized protein n=1 Tax=viral metagenome TaxID=1070528 RepID=A0A6C0HYV2_9ZZZZ
MPTRNIDNFDIDYSIIFNYIMIKNSSCNIILLALSLIFVIIIIESIVTLFINKNRSFYDGRLNGRYRYLCAGTTKNNKRCKNRVINSETCYNHN